MAKRRCFDKEIITSGKFLRLPLSAQAFYFHLSIAADNDGFVDYYGVMCMVKATKDDLNSLLSSNFIEFLPEDKNIIRIIHFKTHNHLPKNYKRSKYTKKEKQEEKEKEKEKTKEKKNQKEKDKDKEKDKEKKEKKDIFFKREYIYNNNINNNINNSLKKEKENTKEKEKKVAEKDFKPTWIEQEDWEDLMEHRRKVKSVNSKRALKILVHEMEKATQQGYTAKEIVDEIIGRGWKGFKAQWMPKTEKSEEEEKRQFIARLVAKTNALEEEKGLESSYGL